MTNFKMNNFFFTFIALFGVSLTYGKELYCWSGHDKTKISNQSCTIENKVLTTGAPDNTTAGASDSTTSQTKDGAQVVAFCYELIYHYNSTLNFESDPIAARTAHSNVSCDFLGLCNDSIVGTRVKTTVNDFEVTLVCCKGDNCNEPSPDVFPVIKPVCNNFQSNGTVAMGYKETCSGTDDLCMSITTYKEETVINQKLQCGSEQQCNATKNPNNQKPLCHTQEGKGNKVEICCCSGDLCFPVPENVTIINPKDNNDTDSALDKVIHKKIQVQRKEGTDWLFVGGLIAAGALVLVVMVTVVVVWQVKKRRKAAARNRMLFSYTPISASEVDDDDVQMLL